MGNPKKITGPLRWSHVAAFRLARHHLIGRTTADPSAGASGKALEEVCRDLCGVQAQVMSSAELACWVRATGISRDAIHSALWKHRTLVRTSCMRQTLHLLPAADFPMYITALKRSRLAAILRGMARLGMTAKDLDELNTLIVEELRSGPKSQRDLTQAIRPKVNPRVRAWMERFWSIVRPAVVEGLVCYGPEQNEGKRNEAVFILVDQWLPRQKRVDELTAQQSLLRSYLRCYGPATVQDFAFWSGIGMKESREIWNTLADELVAVSIESQNKYILNRDLENLKESDLKEDVVRLLPGFDPYLLAHAKKDHIVNDQYYKRVYRNQGWISPVVLVNGKIAGIWSCAKKGKTLSFKAELFKKPPRSQRAGIHDEAEKLSGFLGGSVSIEIGSLGDRVIGTRSPQ
ncbi:MAG TPA: winged helix DNA-binding domain-containing protein [Candidatus Angelobacter sp.]|nr:winged helix DNA-binding domain-containing protein [Candidatus Angelobacter sp.]